MHIAHRFVLFTLLCTLTSATLLSSLRARSLLQTFQNDHEKLPVTIRKGLTGDSCKKNGDCVDGRKCAPINTVTDIECGDRAETSGCECRRDEMESCVRSSECDSGEVCVDSGNTSAQPFCFSKAAAEKDDELNPVDGPTNPNASPIAQANDDVCIAVHSLEHLSQKRLMYARHRLARVLCDANRSCATPGHVVVYHGKPMMMESYCKISVCVPHIMQIPICCGGKCASDCRQDWALRSAMSSRADAFRSFVTVKSSELGWSAPPAHSLSRSRLSR